MIEIPCKCGHYEKDHSQMYCFACFKEDEYLRVVGESAVRGTHKFIADNLLHFERLAKQRGLIK